MKHLDKKQNRDTHKKITHYSSDRGQNDYITKWFSVVI